jgi:hypothetical protein
MRGIASEARSIPTHEKGCEDFVEANRLAEGSFYVDVKLGSRIKIR